MDEVRARNSFITGFLKLDALEVHLASALKTFDENLNTVSSIVLWPWIMSVNELEMELLDYSSKTLMLPSRPAIPVK